MILHTNSPEADAYINHRVLCDNGKCGILVAIYTDVFETTAGITNTIDTDCNNALVTYDNMHVSFLPINFHYNLWSFPDGYTGLIKSVDFNTGLIVDDLGHEHTFVTETK